MFTIPESILEVVKQHALSTYPEECCGFISASKSEPDTLLKSYPMINKMSDQHEADPKSFPRDNKTAYLIDPREQMMLERALKKEGQKVRVIYHSHPDVGAYFSDTDKKDALWDDSPRYPGVSYLVLGASKSVIENAVIVNWDDEKNDFILSEIKL